METQMNYRQKMALQTRQTIIETAIELFHLRGYKNVHINDIVNATGMSRGSFYAHFKDKDDLLCSAIFKDLDDEYLTYYENELVEMEQHGVNGIELLRCYLLKVNDLITQNGPDLLRHYYGYTIASSQILLEENRHYLQILEQLISKCRAQNLLNEKYTDPQLREKILMLERSIAIEWAMRDGKAEIDNWNYLIEAMLEEISD